MVLKSHNSKHRSWRVAVDYALCLFCGACVGTCPENALTLNGTHLAAGEKCTACAYCVQACPAGALSLVKNRPEVVA